MSSEERWEKHLTVTSGKVWLKQVGTSQTYEVMVLALCYSENGEPFRVWFQLAQYPLDFDAPEQPDGFWINTSLGNARCRITLRARPLEQDSKPPTGFLRFCSSLLNPAGEDDPSGYTFSTQVTMRVQESSGMHPGLPVDILFSDPAWDPREGRVLQFAHLAKPFTLVWDKSQYECKQCTSPQQFEDILKDLYKWPLDRL